MLALTDFKGNAGLEIKGGAASAADAEFCPVTGFEGRAIEWCMPPALRRLAEEAFDDSVDGKGREGAAQYTPLRIWVRSLEAFSLTQNSTSAC